MNKVFLNKLTGVFVALVFFVFIFLSQVRAEEGVPEEGLQISPTRFDLELKPGMETTRVVNVKNYDKESSYYVESELENFYIKNDGSSRPQYVNEGEKVDFQVYDVASWIEVEKDFTLEPNEAKNIEVKIKAPEDLPTGSYYGAIVFKTEGAKKDDEQEESGTKLKHYFAARIPLFNAVRGNEPVKFEGELLEFFPEHKIFFGLPISKKLSLKENLFNWGGPVNLVTHVKNTGNLHYKVEGKIDVYKFGKYYKTIEIKEQIIHPDRIRIYNNQFNFRWWDFGIYRAEVKLDSVDQNIHLEAKSESWIVFPWKTTLVLILFIIANYFERKRSFKRKQNQEK